MITTDVKPAIEGDYLELRYDNIEVGRLIRLKSNVIDLSFKYSREWLDRPGSFPISVTMPLSEQEYLPQLVYPWFLNLLPEGSALSQIGHILHVSELDVFGMLAQMGRDIPGAFEIRPPGGGQSQDKPRYRSLTESELFDAISKLPERPILVGEDGVHMSLAGAQDKLPVAIFSDGQTRLALNGAPTTHILKPRNKRFHASVENEAFCLRLAKAIGLPAPPVSMHRAGDIEYLLVKRYDRVVGENGINRLHQEDFCQATAFPPYLKYEWNAALEQHGPGAKLCLDALSGTLAPAPVKLAFFRLMVFNIICGNVDAHAKNYSLLLSSGQAQMAPIYDVMNGDIYENVTRNLAMKIAGQSRARHIYGRHWERFAEENGLSPTGLKRVVSDVSQRTLKALPRVIDDMEKSSIPSYVYKEIGGYVERYCRSMLINLDTVEPHEEDKEDQEVALNDIDEADVVPIPPGF